VPNWLGPRPRISKMPPTMPAGSIKTTVQAGKPMTVKVMGKQASACFPSLV
jgi:hypothetical protein